jgi:uncharacterized membrane protein
MNLEKIFSSIIIAVLILVIIGLLIFNKSEDKEGFTELYFIGDLPKTIETGEQQSFSFGIHNLENRDMLYSYTVYFQSDELSSGYANLKDDETAILNQGFMVKSKNNDTIKISVRLNTDEEIHFWADVE